MNSSTSKTLDAPLAVKPLTSLNACESDERNLAYVVYGLLFISPFSLGLTALIGVVLAYIKKHDCTSYIQTHFRYQIKSFWVIFALWAIATFIAVICTVFLTWTLVNLIWTQYDITDWRQLDIDLSDFDTSQISVSTLLGVASGYVVSAILTVMATVWILIASVMGLIRLNHHKPIGKRFQNA
ncbi:hypothetical protein PQU92_01350 [Asticcacaulis sp. BYS171W]|uniref:DUF4870 domain-containing protein n=1 Tax=Asticcacaulis aquaticus TaxID=2984212 RepID=A0ABT5HPA8_9CAUL|nr:hypothetical protein [Asticcacaulis aquaticus]MDC7681902.1 hypothetical protein [Asticcacaulis aquaticus]